MATRNPPRDFGFGPDDEIAWDLEDNELDPEDYDAMPQELREIYDAPDEMAKQGDPHTLIDRIRHD